MNYESTTDVFVASALTGAVIGSIIGVLPFLAGHAKGRKQDATSALLLCGVFGALGGWQGAAIMAGLAFLYIVWKPAVRTAPKQTKRIPCPHCREMIMPGEKLCRFCGRSLVKSDEISQ